MERQEKTARPALKICGITAAEDAALCVRLGVDFVGFNLCARSRRFVSAGAARALWQEALRLAGQSGHVTTRPAIVVVDEAAAGVAALLAAFPECQAVQMHGRETPERMV